MESAFVFFFTRKQVDFGIKNASSSTKRFIEYQAAPQTIATVISSKLATLHELNTVYGVEDLWIFLEIHAVDRHNAYLVGQK